ncbi:hypothetical protein XELAEV_180095221mg, partial [Xenopus laevis]
GLNNQYAYVALFTVAQCRQLADADLRDALRQEDAANLVMTVADQQIYRGTKMVAASYLQIDNQHAVHAEARLLNGEGNAPSPVQDLINRNEDRGCVLFYTLNSPCTGLCVRIGGQYNILNKLNVFDNINNRALVYNDVYFADLTRKEDIVWAAWAAVNARIGFYRCFNNRCVRCFKNGTQNSNCYYT